ncbi:MAG: SUMF1/EgtB/PvdO family nonheme iron enzyme, partial [Phycisphaerae bacterium]|nr:SUMF1/EgtB/PvdO family nonheme iron enzyme [Phycisphaerae bacterium]
MERTCRLILVGLLIATAAQTATAAYNIADLNKDGIVDMVDLAIFADNWQSMAYFPDPDITFVPIGAVTFLMGDETGYGGSNEKPVHAVTLDAFEISKYEVTNHQYALFLNSAKVNRLAKVVNGIVYDAGDADNTEPWFKTYAAESDSSISYSGGVFGVRNSDGKDMKAHPVREVTWFGAKAFCDYYGWRLPTEAEWECAARGGYHDPYGKYPWGSDDINGSRCNYGGNTPPPRTTPVGNYPAWGYGICDMAGNVYEWCNDWYAADYY